MTSLYPRSEINIYIQVLAMDGGSSRQHRRTASSWATNAEAASMIPLKLLQPFSRRR
jgi:ribonuclease PH